MTAIEDAPARDAYGSLHSDPIKKGTPIHVVLSSEQTHRLTAVFDLIASSDSVMVRLTDMSGQAYTSQFDYDPAAQTVGTWHWPES